MAFFPSKPAPTTISAMGVAVAATLFIAFNGIVGILSPVHATIIPRKIPIIIGFFSTLIKDFLIASLPFLLSLASTVRIITEYILYSGTADTIISGPIPELPYILSINAIPRIAALPRTLPCANAPTMLLSLIKILARSHTMPNITVVTIMQKRTNLISNSERISAVPICLKSNTGKATLNTYLSATSVNSLVRNPTRISI